MRPRRQCMLAVGLATAGIAIAAVFTLQAFEDNMMFYVEISGVHAGKALKNRLFLVGGIVAENSIERSPGDLTVRFTLTDLQAELPVVYTGVLPDLFR